MLPLLVVGAGVIAAAYLLNSSGKKEEKNKYRVAFLEHDTPNERHLSFATLEDATAEYNKRIKTDDYVSLDEREGVNDWNDLKYNLGKGKWKRGMRPVDKNGNPIKK